MMIDDIKYNIWYDEIIIDIVQIDKFTKRNGFYSHMALGERN